MGINRAMYKNNTVVDTGMHMVLMQETVGPLVHLRNIVIPILQ